MNWNKSVFLACLIVSGCQVNESKTDGITKSHESKFIIEASELMAIMYHDSIAILDLRTPEDYSKGHLPKSVNIWRSEIQNDSFPYGGMISNRDHLENVLSRKGIKSNQFLVLYDDRGSCEAARLWWMLNHHGYSKTAILNGGLKAWNEVGELSNTTTKLSSGHFKLAGRTNPSSNIKLSELSNDLADYVIIDTRSKEEYTGKTLKKGATTAGRIPGSVHLEWSESVNENNDKFKSRDELEKLFKDILKENTPIITYCHSGVRSAHTYFVLTELLGLKNVKNYDGSWVEWSYHKLPRESDSLVIL